MLKHENLLFLLTFYDIKMKKELFLLIRNLKCIQK